MASALDAFRDKLDQLTDLSDADLTQLESDIMAAFDAADTSGDTTGMEELADALDQIRAEMENRSGDDDTEAVEAAATTEATNEKEATVASSNIPQNRAPKTVDDDPTNVVVAAADVPGHSAGSIFKSMEEFSKAFATRVNSLTRVRGGDGERVLVASIQSTVPEERMLRQNDVTGNFEKIRAVTDPKAITAAGGCCAPLTTHYDLFTIGETARPVRDSLAGFQADRGGIRHFGAPTLANMNTATGFWDCDADEAYDAANESTWKVCARIECPPEAEALTEAVTMCLTFGVMSSRVFPENVAANTQLALVQNARLAESALLAKIKAGSTQIAGPAVLYGAVRDLLLTVARVVAWYRDRNRLGENTPVRAIMPVWLLDLMRADMIVQPPAGDGRVADFAISANDIENFFDEWGVNITWALDSADRTAGGSTFGALIDAADPAPVNVFATPLFPTSVEWAMFAEGTWLFLDGGSLDLGIIRDSKLVQANDYTQFSEVFEGAAKIGGESLWITSPIEVRGAYSKSIA